MAWIELRQELHHWLIRAALSNRPSRDGWVANAGSDVGIPLVKQRWSPRDQQKEKQDLVTQGTTPELASRGDFLRVWNGYRRGRADKSTIAAGYGLQREASRQRRPSETASSPVQKNSDLRKRARYPKAYSSSRPRGARIESPGYRC
jgi:hypothetical protein